jgi:hypothetical protein
MITVFGVFDPQAFVVLIISVLGLVPVVLYSREISRWFVLPYVFLFAAAFTTNFENAFLPDLLNFTEHLVGNLGAGIGFALAAYMYRKQSISGEDGLEAETEA